MLDLASIVSSNPLLHPSDEQELGPEELQLPSLET